MITLIFFLPLRKRLVMVTRLNFGKISKLVISPYKMNTLGFMHWKPTRIARLEIVYMLQQIWDFIVTTRSIPHGHFALDCLDHSHGIQFVVAHNSQATFHASSGPVQQRN